MSFWNESLNTFAALWLETVVRACVQGGLALGLVWATCRFLPCLSAGGRSVLWRLAYLKLLVAFLWLPTLDLPLLPPAAPTAWLALPSVVVPWEVSTSEVVTAGRSPTEGLRTVAVSTPAPTVAGWLLLFWTTSLCWQGGQAIRQCFAVRRLRRTGSPLDGGSLDVWNVALSRDLKLDRVSRLLSSTATDTPLLIGVFRPCIVLPEALLTTCAPEELRLILAHELAHVRRRDLLWGWLPLLARLVCGFHPLVRLAERELGMAQEIACDETALHLTGAASAAYGRLLVRVAAHFDPCPSHGFGMIGMTESYYTLKRRLSAMKNFVSVPRRHRTGVRFGLLTLGLAALVPWRVAAQSTPPAQGTPTVPTVPVTAPAAIPPETPAAPGRLDSPKRLTPPLPTPVDPTATPLPETPSYPSAVPSMFAPVAPTSPRSPAVVDPTRPARKKGRGSHRLVKQRSVVDPLAPATSSNPGGAPADPFAQPLPAARPGSASDPFGQPAAPAQRGTPSSPFAQPPASRRAGAASKPVTRQPASVPADPTAPPARQTELPLVPAVPSTAMPGLPSIEPRPSVPDRLPVPPARNAVRGHGEIPVLSRIPWIAPLFRIPPAVSNQPALPAAKP